MTIGLCRSIIDDLTGIVASVEPPYETKANRNHEWGGLTNLTPARLLFVQFVDFLVLL